MTAACLAAGFGSGLRDGADVRGVGRVSRGRSEKGRGHRPDRLVRSGVQRPGAAPARAGRRPGAAAPGPARTFNLARRAGEGVRQSLFPRPDRVFGVGGQDVRGHHRHRHHLRLLGRGRSGRTASRSSASTRRPSNTRSSATGTSTIPAAPSICRIISARASSCPRRIGTCSTRATSRSRNATWWQPTA